MSFFAELSCRARPSKPAGRSLPRCTRPLQGTQTLTSTHKIIRSFGQAAGVGVAGYRVTALFGTGIQGFTHLRKRTEIMGGAGRPAITRSVASLISSMDMAFLLRRAARIADLEHLLARLFILLGQMHMACLFGYGTDMTCCMGRYSAHVQDARSSDSPGQLH